MLISNTTAGNNVPSKLSNEVERKGEEVLTESCRRLEFMETPWEVMFVKDRYLKENSGQVIG